MGPTYRTEFKVMLRIKRSFEI